MTKSFIDKLVSKFDSGSTVKFSEVDPFNDQKVWTSTGSPYFDYKLNTLGFPTGIIEIAGKTQSGKTTAALQGMSNFLSANPENGVAVILSSERRDNKEYAKTIGIETERVIVHYSKFVEDFMIRVKKTIKETVELWEKEVS